MSRASTRVFLTVDLFQWINLYLTTKDFADCELMTVCRRFRDNYTNNPIKICGMKTHDTSVIPESSELSPLRVAHVHLANDKYEFDEKIDPKLKFYYRTDRKQPMRAYFAKYEYFPRKLGMFAGYRLDLPLPLRIIPQTLTTLIITTKYDSSVVGSLPATLISLKITLMKGPLPIGLLPESLTKLDIDLKQQIPHGFLPSKLTSLGFGDEFKHPLEAGILPTSLTRLTFGSCWNRRIDNGFLPLLTNLRILQFGENFRRSARSIVNNIPKSLNVIILNETYLGSRAEFPKNWEFKDCYLSDNFKVLIRREESTDTLPPGSGSSNPTTRESTDQPSASEPSSKKRMTCEEDKEEQGQPKKKKGMHFVIS